MVCKKWEMEYSESVHYRGRQCIWHVITETRNTADQCTVMGDNILGMKGLKQGIKWIRGGSVFDI